MPTVDADLLRTRARTLRHLAALVQQRVLLDLCRRAGDDTWRGPMAEQCRDDLRRSLQRLDTDGDELLRQAAVLERRADDLDLLAAVGAAVPTVPSGPTAVVR